MANPFAVAVSLQRDRNAGAYGGSSSYIGGSHSRLTADWVFASIQSADQEVRADLRALRARSRELVRNNDTASRYVALVREQAIGHEGIRFQANVTRPDGRPDMPINQRIEDAWTEWCDPEVCSVDGRMGFVDVLGLAAGSLPQDGESIIRMLPWRGNRFGLALQVLDPDQLDHEYNRAPGDGVPEIRMGVEIDRWGRHLAYHLWDHHPSEYTARGRERIRVPAADVIFLGRPGRPAQTRFVPWFTPALMKLHFTHGYEEASLVAARMGAAQGGFFEVEPEAVGDPNAPDVSQQIEFEIEPGKFDRLPPGWTFKEFRPQHPTTTFKEFHRAMVRGIANGLNVSYTSLANDLEGVNFSSIRAGLLNERDAWRNLQWWLVRHFCRRVYLRFLDHSLLTGALQLPDRNRQRWQRHRWQPRGWPWVDPEKDLRAAALAIRLGVDSRTRIAAERGLDFEEILADIAAEEELARAMGVTLSTDLSRAGGNSQESTRDDDEEEGSDDTNALVSVDASRVHAMLEQRRSGSRLLARTNGNGRH